MKIRQHSRREFLALTGIGASGLLLSACLPDKKKLKSHRRNDFQPNVFVAIETNGRVTITASRSEMGQGVRTSLPQILADELDADWQRVSVVQAQGDEKYGNQDTDGSRSIRNHYQPMREFGASARYLLLAAAAKQWAVAVEECSTELHRVVHPASGQQLDYGALVKAARGLQLPRKFTPQLKTPEQFRYIGKSQSIVDLADITTGQAGYGIDIQLPNMLHASISRCPVIGGRLISYDDEAARAIAGVIDILEIPRTKGPPGFNPLPGIAVVASNSWSALRGREALDITWDFRSNGDDNSDAYIEQLTASSHQPGTAVRQQGDVEQGFAAAAQLVEADYIVPYLSHATMEPPVATAWYHDGHCEVWAPTQNPQGAAKQLASMLDLANDAVSVNITLLGGGFGRKSKPDFILEAAWLSRAVKAPVKLTWSREDDIRHDYYHAASSQYMKAGLSEDGRAVAWLHRSIYPAIGTTFSRKADNLGELGLGCVDVPYDIANIRIEGGKPKAPLRIGWLRSVGNIQHAFAVNSFACELAHAAGRDPAAYLLELIGPERMVSLGENSRYSNYGMPLEDYPIDTARLRRVTETAIKAAGWDKPLPPGHGIGIAAHRSFLSYVASVVEVSTSEAGQVKVERIVSAADVGRIINPERLRSQMEGGALFGLSIALFGEISTRDGQVQQSNFHDYRVLRMHDTPTVEIHLLDSEHLPTGAGEPPTPPIAPALCNAIHSATGKRIRRLPVSRHGLV